jgi:hypothetical protein
MNIDFEHCCKHVHVFLEDPIRKFIDYLSLSTLFANKIYVTSHNSCEYEAHFQLRTFLELKWELKWVPELIMDCTKIFSMCVENLNLLNSLNCSPKVC